MKPSVALKIGYSLSECAGLLKSETIIVEDNDGVTAADRFLHLYHHEWRSMVSSRALGSLHERWNAPSKMPQQRDVEQMSKVLHKEMAHAKSQFQETPSFEDLMLA